MMKRFFKITLFILLTSAAFGQKAELGFGGGVLHYVGDLNPRMKLSEFGYAGTAYYRYNYNTRYSLKINALYGKVLANDSNNDFEVFTNRNLSFQSSILELGGQMELNFYELKKKKNDVPYTAYLFAGLNYFRMNPRAEYNDELTDLRPLSTEGQGTSAGSKKQYRLNQIAIPFGIGMKFNLSEVVVLNIESGLRKTYTDYLDDVSDVYIDPRVLSSVSSPSAAEIADPSEFQEGVDFLNGGVERGNPETKDWYLFTGISLSFRIGKEPCYSFKGD